MRYLVAVAAYRRPQYFLRLLNSFDEVYALLSVLIEQHFLRAYNSSFIENFYGLKRERVLRLKSGEITRAQLSTPVLVRETLQLRKNDVWKNLAVLVALPYVKRKLDEAYEVYVAQANIVQRRVTVGESLQPDATLRQRFLYCFKWFLRKIYPSLTAAYHFAILAFNLAYLFGRSKYHSPLMWLVGTRVRRMTAIDHQNPELSWKSAHTKRLGVHQNRRSALLYPWKLAQAAYPHLLSSLRFVLPTSIFALKFLEWWHASDFARQLSRKAIEGLDLPRPSISRVALSQDKTPQGESFTSNRYNSNDRSLEKSGEADSHYGADRFAPPISRTTLLPIHTVSLPSSSSHCPICTSPIVTPTAAPTGYVYCYTCIHKWVDGSHEQQAAFMEATEVSEGWGEGGSRRGQWESGRGRCAVTGMKLLGGTEALRRIIV